MNCFERGARTNFAKALTWHGSQWTLGTIPCQVIRGVENHLNLAWPSDIGLSANRSGSSLNQSFIRRTCHLGDLHALIMLIAVVYVGLLDIRPALAQDEAVQPVRGGGHFGDIADPT